MTALEAGRQCLIAGFIPDFAKLALGAGDSEQPRYAGSDGWNQAEFRPSCGFTIWLQCAAMRWRIAHNRPDAEA